MIHKKDYSLIGFTFIVLLIGILAWLALLAPVVEAGLPVRDTPTPVPSENGDGDRAKDSGSIGAWIELQTQNAPAGAWSVVQWQNSNGNWENVDGWQGTLDSNGLRRWWAAEKDFGDGPFRWVVTQGKGGPVLGTSQSFYLPAGANETVWVKLTLQ
jgi:hypothetical protein